MLDNKPQRLSACNHNPGFKVSMQAKDLNIIIETARQYGAPLSSGTVAAQLFNAMLENDMAGLDTLAVLEMIEMLAGTTLKTPSAD
jgi:2-hydroxy-3-oxopropionate reductase